MISPKWENALIVLLTVVVLGFVEYGVYHSGVLKKEVSTLSLLDNEIRWTSEIEGSSLKEVFRADSSALLGFRSKKGIQHVNFIVIVGDSSCKPCFGNHVKEYILGLRERNCSIDPSQWVGVYVGKNNALGESTFRGVFGAKAGYVTVSTIDPRFLKGDDGLILATTSDNTILACSKISKASASLKSYFMNRAANMLLADMMRNEM